MADRVDRHEVDTRGQTAFERQFYGGFRWWTAAELVATDEVVYPFRLGDLLSTIVAGGGPAEPVELPWHH